jgi:hypothetical protein
MIINWKKYKNKSSKCLNKLNKLKIYIIVSSNNHQNTKNSHILIKIALKSSKYSFTKIIHSKIQDLVLIIITKNK